MGDMLSQAEIDALLGGAGSVDEAPEEPSVAAEASESIKPVTQQTLLTSEQKDILGEIGNISMGTAATTLFQLLNQKVWITTPHVQEITWPEIKNMYDKPCVGIRVGYKEGLVGSNILILKERDVKIIANLMMGGEGTGDDIDGDLTEIDLSAIGEAMNQMVGSSSTSLSSMTKMKIDINTPEAFVLKFDEDKFLEDLGSEDYAQEMVAILFRMEVGSLIDSQIMQMMPTKFAISMVDVLKSEFAYNPTEGAAEDLSMPSMPSLEPELPMPEIPMPDIPMPDMAAQSMPYPQMQDPNFAYGAPLPQAPYQQTPYPQAPYQQAPYPQAPYQQAPDQYMSYGYGAQGPQPQVQQPYMQQPYGQQPYMPPPPQPQPQQNVNIQQAQFQSFDYAGIMQQKENIGIIMDVPLEVNVELGRTTKLIKEILEFGPGTVIELDKLAGEPVDIYVNGKHVAKGEVVVIDENFGIRITDIVSVENRI